MSSTILDIIANYTRERIEEKKKKISGFLASTSNAILTERRYHQEHSHHNRETELIRKVKSE